MPQLNLAVTDRVATVTFDNPPLQVMTPATVAELAAMLPRLRQDDIGAVVLTGSSAEYFVRHFSVEELDSSARGQGSRWDVSLDDVLLDLENLPKPVIAALNGSAMGGGLELALATDIRVAKDGPFRYGLPEISVGILPGAGGTQRLTNLVGRPRALNLMLRAQLLSPGEAYSDGIVDELVPADSSETALHRAEAIARDIAGRPPLAVAHIKRLVRAAVSPVSRELLELESRLFGELMRSPEARELLAEVAAAHRRQRESET